MAKIGLKRVFVKPLGGRDDSFVEANSQGSAQHTKTNDEPSSCRDLSRPSEVSSTHHCPTGCPFSSRLSSAVEAMPSSNGPGLETGIGHGSSTIGWSTAEPTGPWHHGKYLYSPPVKSQDAWTFVQVGTQQYWVRTHHLHRIQPFHPVHRNQPVQASDLSSRRVTIKFEIGGSGRPERVFDHWTDRSEGHEWSTSEGKRWCGYTFFEMKNNKKDVNKIDHERTGQQSGVQEEQVASGSQVVNVYMDGGMVRTEGTRPFNCDDRLDRDSVYDKGCGKGRDHPDVQEMIRRGYMQEPILHRGYGRGSAAQRGRAAMARDQDSPRDSHDEWAFVTGE